MFMFAFHPGVKFSNYFSLFLILRKAKALFNFFYLELIHQTYWYFLLQKLWNFISSSVCLFYIYVYTFMFFSVNLSSSIKLASMLLKNNINFHFIYHSYLVEILEYQIYFIVFKWILQTHLWKLVWESGNSLSILLLIATVSHSCVSLLIGSFWVC